MMVAAQAMAPTSTASTVRRAARTPSSSARASAATTTVEARTSTAGTRRSAAVGWANRKCPMEELMWKSVGQHGHRCQHHGDPRKRHHAGLLVVDPSEESPTDVVGCPERAPQVARVGPRGAVPEHRVVAEEVQSMPSATTATATPMATPRRRRPDGGADRGRRPVAPASERHDRGFSSDGARDSGRTTLFGHVFPSYERRATLSGVTGRGPPDPLSIARDPLRACHRSCGPDRAGGRGSAPSVEGGGASVLRSVLVSSGAGKHIRSLDQAAPVKFEVPHVRVVGAAVALQVVVPVVAFCLRRSHPGWSEPT